MIEEDEDKIKKYKPALMLLVMSVSLFSFMVYRFIIQPAREKIKIEIPKQFQKQPLIIEKTTLATPVVPAKKTIVKDLVPQPSPPVRERVSNLNTKFKKYQLEIEVTYTEETPIKDALENLEKLLSIAASSSKIKEIKVKSPRGIDFTRDGEKIYDIECEMK